MWWILGILGYLFIGVFAMICFIAYDANQSILNAIDDVINRDFDNTLLLFVFVWPSLIPLVLFIGIYRGCLWIINFIALGISELIDFLKKIK